MTVTPAPIKVDVRTDRPIFHAAHFLEKAKKDVVDIAVREYIEAHRSEINEGILVALGHLDGSSKSAIPLLTDVPADQLDEYGSVADVS
jgi:hypothetical protein